MWLTADRGWVAAGALRPGEALVKLNGGTGVVLWVRVTPGVADRYNLTVAHDHTYAVGAGLWVVHNTCGDSLIDQAQSAAGDRPSATAYDAFNADGDFVDSQTFTSGPAEKGGPFGDIIAKGEASGVDYAGGCGETAACIHLLEEFDGTEVLDGGHIEMGLWHVAGHGPCSVCRGVLQRTATRLNVTIRLRYLDPNGNIRYLPDFEP